MSKRPRFTKKSADGFHVAVKKRIDEWMAINQQKPNANPQMVYKTLFFLTSYLIVWGLILSNLFEGWQLICLWSLFGVVQGLINFNIGHDALHGSYSASSKINRWLGYVYDWNGQSSFVWKETHNGLHHTYTNIAGHDGDIGKGGLLRFSPHDPWIPIHRFQNWYTPFLYSLVSFSWVFWGDYVGVYQILKERKAKMSELIPFFLFKVSNLFFMVILPLMILSAPKWQIGVGFLMMHLVCGFLVSVVFQLAHLVEGVEFPQPNSEGHMEEEWAVHEMKTTSNFATQNLYLSWFLGGLNFQVEHHLFPLISHVHYPEISKIVRTTAKEYGVPYNEHPTFFNAICSHFRLLKKLGNPVRAKEYVSC